MVNARIWLESQAKYNTKEKREKVTELDISNKNLQGELDLSDFVNLKELVCNGNKLTFLNISKQTRLESLTVSKNNFPSENPTWLSHLVNLKELYIRQNNFTGSLEFIRNMNKLEVLDISGTNIDYDLKYLPLSLKWINRNEKIGEELILHGNNLLVWQESHPELVEKKLTENYSEETSEIVTTIPKDLEKGAIPVNYNLNSIDYSCFALRDDRPFSWERPTKAQSLVSQQLPLRLYNVDTDQVIETQSTQNKIDSYATLSYVWGTDWENKIDRVVDKNDGSNYKVRLTKLARKAIEKAQKTFSLLNQGQSNLHYIWIDNYCINQSDVQEKGEEVKKQRIYYNNAAVTLVAVNAKIDDEVDKKNKLEFTKYVIKKIVNSPWFTRSWTFQEGLLSHQTIFMLDNALVDGKILASVWSSIQHSSSWDDNSWIQLNNKIFITPLGWNHYNQKEKNVNMGLIQALDAVKHRKQTLALDGIYSILGLLPYGDKVKTRYKENEHKYTKEELEETLLDIMKLSVQEGFYHEPLVWIGERRSEPELWWIPEMKEDGTANIEGFSKVNAQFENLKITTQGLEFFGKKEKWKWDNQYTTITTDYKKSIKSDERFYILVPTEEKSNLPIKITYSSNPGPTFLENSSTIFIDMINKKMIEGEKEIQEYKAQIEISPRK
jgi:hypothetical protein